MCKGITHEMGLASAQHDESASGIGGRVEADREAKGGVGRTKAKAK
jgi:hypothetical protein